MELNTTITWESVARLLASRADRLLENLEIFGVDRMVEQYVIIDLQAALTLFSEQEDLTN